MRVLTVAYPFAAMGPDAVGGAEQVASTLDAGLVAAGHRSVVIAARGSTVAGRLHPLPGVVGEIDAGARAELHRKVREAIAREGDVDLVHLHGIDFFDYAPAGGPPALATLHLPPGWYPTAIWTGRAWLNTVSAAQRQTCPTSSRLVGTVANGVPVAALGRTRHARRGFALMLGRICPEKGQHLALRAAHAAGVPLLLAGVAYAYPEHQAYLRDEVRPLLDAMRRLVGPIGFARKRRLLSAARCVLIPSLAAETSSLVAMEAAACGTPVIAFRVGALPETVRDGETGFIVDDVAGMARAIGEAGRIDPGVCRAEAASRFDVARMVSEYLALYVRLIG